MDKIDKHLFWEHLTDEQKAQLDGSKGSAEVSQTPTTGKAFYFKPNYLVGNSFKDVAAYHAKLIEESPSSDPLEHKRDLITASFYRRLAALEEAQWAR